MSILTLPLLQKLWPHADQHVQGLAEGIVTASDRVFSKYDINTPLLVAHFMAQASEECGQGLEMTENMNYSASRLRQVWPTHFTPAMAQRAAHNGRLIADIAYGGRMGNAPPPSDDGYNFRGRGLTQTTGREGYENLQKFLAAHGVNIDVMNDPDLVSDPDYTLEAGVADWIICGCLPHAKDDDIMAETRALNGGLNGIAERKRQLKIWKKALGVGK